jgi:hypothetical protein
METPISNSLRMTFLVHMIVALVFGATLWAIPGRTLLLVGWIPDQVQLPQSELSVPGTTFVDGVITRLIGAALLALSFSSFYGWRSTHLDRVKPLVQLEFLFCVLAEIGVLVGILTLERPIPVIGWVLVAILAVFIIAWGLALRR